MGYIGAGISRFNTADELTVTGDAEFNGNANFGDSDKVSFSSGKLEMYHDGTNAYIDETYANGTFLIRGNNISLQKYTGETMIQCVSDGKVELNFNNVPKLETTSSGVSVTGGFTATDGCTITTADNDPQLTLVSTDADATQGPVLKFYRNSASPADNDLIGQLLFHGEDGAGNDQQYANIQSIITNNAHGNESSSLNISTIKGGSVEQSVKFGATETVFNESSLDLDFRVESLGDANSFVVEGATKGIGMGTNDPTIDSSLAGVSVAGASRVLHIHDDSGAYLKLSDPASGSNRGAQFALIGTDAILNNCESGRIIFGTGNTERLRIQSDGRMCKGTTSAIQGEDISHQYNSNNGPGLMMNSTDTSGNTHTQVIFRRNGANVGSIQTNGASTAYNTSSDYRLKEAVTPLTNATDRLKQLNPVRFNFISDADTTVDGFLAHEAQAVVPESVSGTKDAMCEEQYEVTPAVLDDDGNEVTPAEMGTRTVPDYQGIDQSKLVPLLVATIQELEIRIATLEAGE